MKNTKKTKLLYKWAFSNELAIGSFVIGTLLLLLYESAIPNGYVLVTGFYYLFFSIIINSAMLLYLIFLCIILPDDRQKLALKIILLLCNIPIAILYYNIIF